MQYGGTKSNSFKLTQRFPKSQRCYKTRTNYKSENFSMCEHFYSKASVIVVSLLRVKKSFFKVFVNLCVYNLVRGCPQLQLS